MVSINTLFPSKYLKADDIDGEQIVSINGVTQEEVGDEREMKAVVLFAELPKGLVLNKTNASTIAALYGPETDSWKGNRITLFATPVEFKGKMSMGVRVKPIMPLEAAVPAAVPADFDDDIPLDM